MTQTIGPLMTNRPSSISFLSFLYVLVAVIGLIPIISNNEISALFKSDNLFSIITLMLLILSSVGLFMGKKWGWWIVAFFTTFSILSKIPILYWSFANIDFIPDVGKFYLKNAGKMLVQTLILVYLFQENVNQYFQFNNNLSKLKRLGILVLLCIITSGVFYILAT